MERKLILRGIVGIPFLVFALLLTAMMASFVLLGAVFIGASRYAFRGNVNFPWREAIELSSLPLKDFGILDFIDEVRETK